VERKEAKQQGGLAALLQRRAPYMAHGAVTLLNLLHNFLLKSIPI
jgi:hypothetical protein